MPISRIFSTTPPKTWVDPKLSAPSSNPPQPALDASASATNTASVHVISAKFSPASAAARSAATRTVFRRHQADIPSAAFVARTATADRLMMLAMATKKRSRSAIRAQDPFLIAKPRKRVPHEFVLEALADLEPRTNPMFGCLAVYVGEKIVLILRDKRDHTAADDGVWLATTRGHHESLRKDFPNMRSIAVFGKEVTGWQVLPADAPDFETAALRACELIAANDSRIGKIPKAKRTKTKHSNTKARKSRKQ